MSDSPPIWQLRRAKVSEGIVWASLLEGPLQAEDRLFRELAESLPLMIWANDGSGKKVYCNQQYLQYVGVHSPSGMDDGWHHAIHPDDRERAKQAWAAAVRDGGTYECEYRLRGADGVYRVFLARAVPVSDDSGHIIRWLGTSIDLHEDRLAGAHLRQAEKLLAASRCATSVAHQINNPLAAATNAIYLAQQDANLNEETRSYLAAAAAEVARVAHVTARSLGFHKQTDALQQTSVVNVLASVLKFFESRFKEQGLTLRSRVRQVPLIHCFKEDLSQAVSALLINAVEASPRGAVITIRLRGDGLDAEGLPTGIRLTIADSGIGIPDELRDSIFRPFVSTKGDAGVGLGLWMCDQIVKRHSGSLRLRSRTVEPRGTVVVLRLPLHPTVKATTPKQQ